MVIISEDSIYIDVQLLAHIDSQFGFELDQVKLFGHNN